MGKADPADCEFRVAAWEEDPADGREGVKRTLTIKGNKNRW